MSYPDFGILLFFFAWAMCWLAYWLALHFGSNRDSRLIPMLYGIILATFFVAFHGRAQHWHYWWYAWNCIPNAALVIVAWYAPEARARWPLIVVSLGGLLVDMLYFGFAAGRHKLPGTCFFCLETTCETLQVLTMVYFSGPVEPVAKRWWQYLRTRKLPWTHQPRLLHKA